MIADAVANIPFRIVRREGTGWVETHGPAEVFYRRPNPRLNAFQYWELRVQWLLLRGECFRIPLNVVVNGVERLRGVAMPDPAWFHHAVEDGVLRGWRYQPPPPGRHEVYLPNELWHERLSNPFDQWRGMAPMEVAAACAHGEYNASQYMNALLENNGDAGMIVQTPEQLSEEQREALLLALRERKRGAGHADRPLLLWGGAQVAAPPVVAANLPLLDHRRFNLSEIAAIFGVPEELLSGSTSARYDNMDIARLTFLENRIIPLCRRLEAEEEGIIARLEPGSRGMFAVEEHPVLAAARRERLKAAAAGFGMGIPLNDLNRVLELGFRPFEWGNVPYVARNLAPMQAKGEKQ